MSQNDTSKKRTSATILMEIISTLKLVQDDLKNTYVQSLAGTGNSSITPLHSNLFSNWLRNEYYQQSNNFPSQNDLYSAISQAEYLALSTTSIGSIHYRFGFDNKNHYIDMCDGAKEAIEVTSKGWDIIQKPPVYFRNHNSQQALTVPIKGGNYLNIEKYINIEDNNSRTLLLPTICTLPLAKFTRPIIGFVGPQGSAKTSASRIIRNLLDPNDPMENDFNENKQDLILMLYYNALPILDNVSKFNTTVSNILCRSFTGTGFQTRELYSTLGLISISLKRSFLFTSINIPTTAEDLNSRSIIIKLNQISGRRMLSEDDLMTKFSIDMPKILGGMLDILVEAMRILPTMTFNWLPRWADTFKHASAVAEILGIGANHYCQVCRENFENRDNMIFSNKRSDKMIIKSILSLINSTGDFNGSTSQLFEALIPFRPTGSGELADWPDSATKLGKALSRIDTDLEEIGVELTRDRNKAGSVIKLEQTDRSEDILDNQSIVEQNSTKNLPPKEAPMDHLKSDMSAIKIEPITNLEDPLDVLFLEITNSNPHTKTKEQIEGDFYSEFEIKNQESYDYYRSMVEDDCNQEYETPAKKQNCLPPEIQKMLEDLTKTFC